MNLAAITLWHVLMDLLRQDWRLKHHGKTSLYLYLGHYLQLTGLRPPSPSCASLAVAQDGSTRITECNYGRSAYERSENKLASPASNSSDGSDWPGPPIHFEVFQNLCTEHKIPHNCSSAHNPTGNSSSERVNAYIGTAIRATHRIITPQLIQHIEQAIQNAYHQTTRTSPFELTNQYHPFDPWKRLQPARLQQANAYAGETATTVKPHIRSLILLILETLTNLI